MNDGCCVISYSCRSAIYYYYTSGNILGHFVIVSIIVAERLSARLMIVHSALAMVYINVCNASARMRRHVRVPAVRSMGMNSCMCVYCTPILDGVA